MAKKLSIYLNEGDQYKRRALYLELMQFFQEAGCSGGTVLRAVSGFTAGGMLHTTSLVELATTHMPLVVEVVEDEAKLRALIPALRERVGSRLMTLHEVEIL